MEMLVLLATLAPVCCLLGFSIGANLSSLHITHIVVRALLALASIAGVWLLWPSYAAGIPFYKHALVFGCVLVAGVFGGKAYRKAFKGV